MVAQDDDAVTRGRLVDGDAAPADGERSVVLARGSGFTVEQILSGRLGAELEFRQDHDEWVMVVEGSAVVEVDGVPYELSRGDWMLLPAGVPHRLVSTVPGTSWVAVRGRGSPTAGGG
jgi:cupin 2 domain-containing protein